MPQLMAGGSFAIKATSYRLTFTASERARGVLIAFREGTHCSRRVGTDGRSHQL